MSRDSKSPYQDLHLQTVPHDEPAPRASFPPPVVYVPPAILSGVRYGDLTARHVVHVRSTAGGPRPGWRVNCRACGQPHNLPDDEVRRGRCPGSN